MAQFVLFLIFLVFLGSCRETAPGPPEQPPVVTILGAKLIDGTSAEPIEDSVIVVEGSRIRAVGPRSQTPVPKAGERIDASGKVVIPGLVDLHVHYFGDRQQVERSFAAQLYFGVTAVRSIGVDSADNLAVIADARAGKIPAPRIYTAGLGFTHPKGHPVAQPVVRRPATEEEAKAGVRELAAQKADFIKMWVESKYGTLPKISPRIQAAIVEEARKHGIPVVAHIFDEEDVRQLVGLGVQDFLHTVRDQDQVDASFIELCRSQSVSFAPTLTVIERNWLFAEHPEILEDPEVQAALAPDLLRDLQKHETRAQMLGNPELKKLKGELKHAQRFVKQMSEAGVGLVLGSDSGAGVIPTGWGTHNELSLLVDAGLTPLETLRMATRHGAERLAGGESDFGTLQPGKIADLVLLNADPLVYISNTRKIDRVMQAGQWLDRAALLAKKR